MISTQRSFSILPYLAVLVLVISACYPVAPQPSANQATQPAQPAPTPKTQPTQPTLVEKTQPYQMQLAFTRMRCAEETDPKIGSDEAVAIFAMMDADIVLKGNKLGFRQCILDNINAGPEAVFQKCITVLDTASPRIKRYWVRKTPTYTMDSGDDKADNILLSPQDVSRKWQLIGERPDFEGMIKKLVAENPKDIAPQDVYSMTVPAHIVTVLMFELDDGVSEIIKAVEDVMKSMKENTDSSPSDTRTKGELDDLVRSKLRDAERRIVEKAMRLGAEIGAGIGGVAGGGVWTLVGAAAGFVIGGIIGEIVSGKAPEYLGSGSMTFTPVGYLIGLSLYDLIAADPGAREKILACNWVPLEQYSEMAYLDFAGAGGRYRLGFQFIFPFDRKPDPQTIRVSEGALNFDQDRSHTVTISNTGTANLRVCYMAAGGPFFLSVAGFEDACGSKDPSLTPGRSCQVTVAFRRPTTPGAECRDYSSELRIISNDRDHTTEQVILDALPIKKGCTP